MPPLLKLTVISDKNQYLIFLIVYYLIDPNFITLYGKKNQEGDRPRNPPGTSSGGSRGKFGGGNKWHTLFGGSNLNPPKQVEAVRGSNLNPPEQGETVRGSNLNPPEQGDAVLGPSS